MKKAKISEVFFSLQGEGPYAGTAQIFIRFFDCNINCRYCDTRQGNYRYYTPEQLALKVGKMERRYRPQYLCLTGGEPLLEALFIREFLKRLKSKTAVYLETNGILCDEFVRIKAQVDTIAMDIKLPSATGEPAFWKEHERFLRAAKGMDIHAKSIVTLATRSADFKKAVNLLRRVDPKIIFILQPNHAELGSRLLKKMIEYQKYSRDKLSGVRIMPQMHKFLEVR